MENNVEQSGSKERAAATTSFPQRKIFSKRKAFSPQVAKELFLYLISQLLGYSILFIVLSIFYALMLICSIIL